MTPDSGFLQTLAMKFKACDYIECLFMLSYYLALWFPFTGTNLISPNMFSMAMPLSTKWGPKRTWFNKVGLEAILWPAWSHECNPTGLNWSTDCTQSSSPDLTNDPHNQIYINPHAFRIGCSTSRYVCNGQVSTYFTRDYFV